MESHLNCEKTNKRKQQHDVDNEDKEEQSLPYEIELEENESKTADISDHRVVDVNNFFNELVKISSHESLFQCGLTTIKLESEKNSGLTSEFTFSCTLCNTKFKVQNSTQRLNKMAVAGMMAAGCGNAQLKQFSAAIDLPSMSEYRYKIVQDEVCDEWQVTTWEEMRKVGEQEKEAAVKEGKVIFLK